VCLYAVRPEAHNSLRLSRVVRRRRNVSKHTSASRNSGSCQNFIICKVITICPRTTSPESIHRFPQMIHRRHRSAHGAQLDTLNLVIHEADQLGTLPEIIDRSTKVIHLCFSGECAQGRWLREVEDKPVPSSRPAALEPVDGFTQTVPSYLIAGSQWLNMMRRS
jgi:hypothetical protein